AVAVRAAVTAPAAPADAVRRVPVAAREEPHVGRGTDVHGTRADATHRVAPHLRGGARCRAREGPRERGVEASARRRLSTRVATIEIRRSAHGTEGDAAIGFTECRSHCVPRGRGGGARDRRPAHNQSPHWRPSAPVPRAPAPSIWPRST